MKRLRTSDDHDLDKSYVTSTCTSTHHMFPLNKKSLSSSLSLSNRVFECQTCKRDFPSFQALGGHIASHKKSRLLREGEDSRSIQQVEEKHENKKIPKLQNLLAKKKISSPSTTHECPICGQDFPMGQALGGHMRRHRNPSKSLQELPNQLYLQEEQVLLRQKEEEQLNLCEKEEEQANLLRKEEEQVNLHKKEEEQANLRKEEEEEANLCEKQEEQVNLRKKEEEQVHVLKKKSSSKRFSCWDLNSLPPSSGMIYSNQEVLENNDNDFRHDIKLHDISNENMGSKSKLYSLLTQLPSDYLHL